MLIHSFGDVIEEVPWGHHPLATPGLQLLATGARAGVHMVLANVVEEPEPPGPHVERLEAPIPRRLGVLSCLLYTSDAADE